MPLFTSQRGIVCLEKGQVKWGRREEVILFTRELRKFGKTWKNTGKKAVKAVYLEVICPKWHGVEAMADRRRD